MKKSNIIIIILLVLLIFILSGYIFLEKTNLLDKLTLESNFDSNGNIQILLRDEEERIEISKEEIKERVLKTKTAISDNYSNIYINQINDIKFIYNYKNKSIEKMKLSVNFNQYYKTSSNTKSAGATGSLDKNGRYEDSRKNGVDLSSVYSRNNLEENEGLVELETNSVLEEIKNEINGTLDNTFYWERTKY